MHSKTNESATHTTSFGTKLYYSDTAPADFFMSWDLSALICLHPDTAHIFPFFLLLSWATFTSLPHPPSPIADLQLPLHC